MPRAPAPRGRCAVALGFVIATVGSPVTAQTVEPLDFERTGVFRRINESSGVAVSRNHPGVLWTHNDSGDDPVVYATNLAGDDLGEHRLLGVRAVDWEDIAVGRCFDGVGDCLYIADTGDNLETRSHALIHVIREPAPRTRHPVAAVLRTLRVRYPDRPHDVEALAVTPLGEILLVTKGRTGAIQVFCIPTEAATGDTVTARTLDTLSIVPFRSIGRVVTGAAISPNGGRLVIRTYTQLFFYRRQTNGHLTPLSPSCWLGLREPQGEGVDFVDEETLVLTSEAALGHPGTISTVHCPPSADA